MWQMNKKNDNIQYTIIVCFYDSLIHYTGEKQVYDIQRLNTYLLTDDRLRSTYKDDAGRFTVREDFFGHQLSFELVASVGQQPKVTNRI